MTDQPSQQRQITCIKCKLLKDEQSFRAQSLARSFYTCKSCIDKLNIAYRRLDPASRLACRVRSRGHHISVKDVRHLLESVDKDAIEKDSLIVVRERPEEPWRAGNLKLITRTTMGRRLATA